MKKIKHSKFKNTGILFELLVRQVTADILNGNEVSTANKLLRKYFSENTDLGKENKLYQLIINERVKTSVKAARLLEAIVIYRKKLSLVRLSKQKFALVKEIKENYPVDDFFRAPLSDYKLMASIYKVFESAIAKTDYDPKEVFTSQDCILEHLIKATSQQLSNEKEETLKNYKEQAEDLRLLTYKMLIDSFNKKYNVLTSEQKEVLREYINNISNTNSLRDFINKRVPSIKKKLSELLKTVDNAVTRIKLKEVIKQMDKVKGGKVVKDNQVTTLLMAYQLIDELKKAQSNDN